MYELFNKSGIPALVEILKINIPKETREATYTLYFVLSFLESICLGFVIAWALDWDSSIWQILVGGSALIGLSSVFFQLAVPIPQEQIESIPETTRSQRIVQPWKEAFALLKAHPEFARFQYGFMLGGFSLMLVAPSLSVFYVDYLDLPFSSVVTGRSILMGAGIVLSSWFWKRILTRERVRN